MSQPIAIPGRSPGSTGLNVVSPPLEWIQGAWREVRRLVDPSFTIDPSALKQGDLEKYHSWTVHRISPEACSEEGLQELLCHPERLNLPQIEALIERADRVALHTLFSAIESRWSAIFDYVEQGLEEARWRLAVTCLSPEVLLRYLSERLDQDFRLERILEAMTDEQWRELCALTLSVDALKWDNPITVLDLVKLGPKDPPSTLFWEPPPPCPYRKNSGLEKLLPALASVSSERTIALCKAWLLSDDKEGQRLILALLSDLDRALVGQIWKAVLDEEPKQEVLLSWLRFYNSGLFNGVLFNTKGLEATFWNMCELFADAGKADLVWEVFQDELEDVEDFVFLGADLGYPRSCDRNRFLSLLQSSPASTQEVLLDALLPSYGYRQENPYWEGSLNDARALLSDLDRKSLAFLIAKLKQRVSPKAFSRIPFVLSNAFLGLAENLVRDWSPEILIDIRNDIEKIRTENVKKVHTAKLLAFSEYLSPEARKVWLNLKGDQG